MSASLRAWWIVVHRSVGYPTDCSPSDSSVHGLLQARTLEWVAISFYRGYSRPRDRTWVSCTAYVCVYIFVFVVLLLSCIQLFYNPMDGIPSYSSVLGISQARILEWVAISFSRGSSQAWNWTHVSCIGRQSLYHWACIHILQCISYWFCTMFFSGR